MPLSQPVFTLALLVCLVSLEAAAQPEPPSPATATQGLLNTRVSHFEATGSTCEVVRALVRSLSIQGIFKGVFGFENVAALPQRNISLASNGQDLATLLDGIARQDPRLKISGIANPQIVNLLATDTSARGHDVLEFRLTRLDIEADISSEHLIARLPEYSSELNGYLLQSFKRNGGTEPRSGAGSGLHGNAKLPHFSIHLKSVSVREALNAIALESFRMYLAIGRDPRMVSRPDDLVIWPTGWEFHFVEPAGMSYDGWLREIFRPLN